jgi:hypothetical protein
MAQITVGNATSKLTAPVEAWVIAILSELDGASFQRVMNRAVKLELERQSGKVGGLTNGHVWTPS